MTGEFKNVFEVAIVGGGIAGLATAWYLEREADAAGLPLRYTLLEADKRWGGHILTERVEGPGGEFVVEGGPDSFLTQKPWAWQLAKELGLQDRLLGTNDSQRRVYVLQRGRPVPLPDGVLLIVPTQFTPFITSPLISPWGKLRMGLDLLLPPRRDEADETLADFVRRRLGSEALDKIAEPLLSGIYNSEAERQSLLATFPRFRALEAQYGSLTRGMLAARRSRNGKGNGKVGPRAPTPSLFMSLRGGLSELVEALTEHLHGETRLGRAVRRLERRPGETYALTTAEGETVHARAVVLAVPAFVAAGLLRDLAPEAASRLDTIRYVSTGTLSLAYRRAEVTRPLSGFGVVMPRSERRPINAITFSGSKFDHRAPADHVLLRVFFGGSRSPQTMELDDDALLAVVRRELRTLLGIEAAPQFHRLYRWTRANPQYDIGHLERVTEMEGCLPAGVHLTGSAFRGVGLPDCIKYGQETSKRVIAELRREE